MNPGTVSSIDPTFLRAVRHADEAALQQLHVDGTCPHFVDVDWREEDDAIVTLIADAIGMHDLHADWDDDTLVITHGDSERRVPMQMDPADRDATIRAVNALLQPEHEIRYISLSAGSDTMGFCVLRAADWQIVEQSNPQLVADLFLKLDGLPNLIDELTIASLPQGAQGAVERMIARNRQR